MSTTSIDPADLAALLAYAQGIIDDHADCDEGDCEEPDAVAACNTALTLADALARVEQERDAALAEVARLRGLCGEAVRESRDFFDHDRHFDLMTRLRAAARPALETGR